MLWPLGTTERLIRGGMWLVKTHKPGLKETAAHLCFSIWQPNKEGRSLCWMNTSAEPSTVSDFPCCRRAGCMITFYKAMDTFVVSLWASWKTPDHWDTFWHLIDVIPKAAVFPYWQSALSIIEIKWGPCFNEVTQGGGVTLLKILYALGHKV